jgi:transposase
MGVDEIYFGKQMKFITVVSNLATSEPWWFGRDRRQETLDEFFRTQLKESQREHIEAACVDMWRPFTNSIEQWARNCRIVFDKFHVVQDANKAIDEVREGGVFPQRRAHARGSEGQTLAAVDALDESGQPETSAAKRSVRPQSASDESLPSEGKLGALVDLPL